MDVSTPSYGPSKAAPLGYLVPVFAGEDGLPCAQLAIAAAKQAALAGHSVLIVDCDGGHALKALSVDAAVTLSDVLADRAELSDAKYLTPDQAMTVSRAGNTPLETLLGALAVMSLSYDWVFVIPPAGCTPAHVRLAAAADETLMVFHSSGDRFMRAYWMLDAIRARAPKCDPLMVIHGPKSDAREAYGLFCGTVREFLGAPPSLAAISESKALSEPVAREVFTALTATLSESRAA